MSNQVTPETKKVSTVLDKSARALATGQAAIGKVITDLESGVSTLVAQQQSLALDIEFKGRELAEVTANTDAAVREAKIELDFRVRENEDKVRNDLLKKAGLVATTQAELDAAEDQIAELTTAANQTEFRAVKAKEQEVAAAWQARVLALESNHKVQMAELVANANADKQHINSLTEQVDQLRGDLKAEREARVQMAEAASKAAGVVVNAGK